MSCLMIVSHSELITLTVWSSRMYFSAISAVNFEYFMAIFKRHFWISAYKISLLSISQWDSFKDTCVFSYEVPDDLTYWKPSHKVCTEKVCPLYVSAGVSSTRLTGQISTHNLSSCRHRVSPPCGSSDGPSGGRTWCTSCCTRWRSRCGWWPSVDQVFFFHASLKEADRGVFDLTRSTWMKGREESLGDQNLRGWSWRWGWSSDERVEDTGDKDLGEDDENTLGDRNTLSW